MHHVNVGSAMLAGLALFAIGLLLAGLITSGGKKPYPKRPTAARRTARAVRIARADGLGPYKTLFVSYEDDSAHPVATGTVRNTSHPSGYLVHLKGDQVLLAAVEENEVLSTVSNRRFAPYHG